MKAQLAAALENTRAITRRIAADLPEPLLYEQLDPEFSPIGWHLGHIAWQEELWLLRRVGGRPCIEPGFDRLFDSFRSDKAGRGAALPRRAELDAYAHRVRSEALEVLERAVFDASPLLSHGHVFRFIAGHEQQHAEIIATLRVSSRVPIPASTTAPAAASAESARITFPRSEHVFGTDDELDAWDNERRQHWRELPEFALSNVLVTNGEWLDFMQAGGYDREAWWCADGWRWRQRAQIQQPLHWYRDSSGSYYRHTLLGPRPVAPELPVVHVSWYEASAFARFAGARLPTEAEWEAAARFRNSGQRYPWQRRGSEPPQANLALRYGDVVPCGVFSDAVSGAGIHDLAGQVWEWTASAFAPYEGFVPGIYPGYSAPWFDGAHMVARGGSFASALAMARVTFRNWYRPWLRQPALGVRLAFDAVGTVQTAIANVP